MIEEGGEGGGRFPFLLVGADMAPLFFFDLFFWRKREREEACGYSLGLDESARS